MHVVRGNVFNDKIINKQIAGKSCPDNRLFIWYWAAVAKAYSSEGARVVINYSSNKKGAEETADSINRSGGKALIIKADVSKSSEVEEMVEKTHKEFGPVDILVNNAGIYPRDMWDTITEEKWDRVIDINMKGYFLCARAIYKDMQEKNYGKIINVSSIAAISGSNLVHYGSSKTGIIGFTRGLALAFGQYNICVNTIVPGAIKVEREIELDTEQERIEAEMGAIESQCIKRRGTPEDTVGAFIFYASNESDWITGHCLTVDGGWKKY